jgi:hypothetical protein
LPNRILQNGKVSNTIQGISNQLQSQINDLHARVQKRKRSHSQERKENAKRFNSTNVQQSPF